VLDSGLSQFALPLYGQNLSDPTSQSLCLTGGIIALAGCLKTEREKAFSRAVEFQRELL